MSDDGERMQFELGSEFSTSNSWSRVGGVAGRVPCMMSLLLFGLASE
jgi:hypothetical protein